MCSLLRDRRRGWGGALLRGAVGAEDLVKTSRVPVSCSYRLPVGEGHLSRAALTARRSPVSVQMHRGPLNVTSWGLTEGQGELTETT
ncbi:hypothetical protein EYF80_050394 [Liparis tanakae]|uniref:Uncharacterized protein n=1 Tax=Liparis tanakae TaxID=230148 RepID=A0A4Z2FE82_9TELE|nr:hypothetical protein EYF80_050394 [Liparis tanakae]